MKQDKNIYDNNQFFNEYQKMRSEKINSNILVEIPGIKRMLPDLTNKIILDLGCGTGVMSRFFIKKGAKKVLALDISNNMISEAKRHSSKGIEYMVLSMDKLDQIEGEFDIVFSSLAFHYVKNFKRLMFNISRLLKSGGYLVFSQEHPLVTSTIANNNLPKYYQIDGKRYYILADYQRETKRIVNWFDTGVIKYHRTLETVVNSITSAEMQVIKLMPSKPSKRSLKLLPKLTKEFERPMYLFVKAQKK